jgi:AGCS family alanine or glycine:cation symporter
LRDLYAETRLGEPGTGTHPFKLYFASVGGAVGLTNVVSVLAAVTIGGPGGLVWIWITAFAGMLVKYCEIYLGIIHRVRNHKGGYDGGPMYYLQAAFNNRILPIVISLLICIYATDVSQFLIISDTVTETIHGNHLVVTLILLAFVLIVAKIGTRLVAQISLILMPPFLVSYIFLCIWVIGLHAEELWVMLPHIFRSAFEGHAALGGFAGSTLWMALHCGMSRAVYSGDIGIGFDATVQSESRVQDATKQARFAVFALTNDLLICTLSCLLILATGMWTQSDLEPSQYVTQALSLHFPHAQWFMRSLLCVTGFVSIITFLTIGFKSARFLHARFGEMCFTLYSIVAFVMFSFAEQDQVIMIMSASSGMLLLVNMAGIFKLRRQIVFRPETE